MSKMGMKPFQYGLKVIPDSREPESERRGGIDSERKRVSELEDRTNYETS
jgi:hypothetical protein